MSVLDVVSGLANAGAGAAQGYALDQRARVADLLAKSKTARDDERARVANLVALAGIDPDVQGSLAGARASATIPADVERARQMVPIHTGEAVGTATALAPITEQTHERERLFDNKNQPPDKPSVTVQQPLTPGDPAQAVVVDPSDPAHPKVAVAPIPGVAKGGTRGAAENPEIAATRKDLKDFQGQQVRAEHDVSSTAGDIRALLASSPRASQPLAEQRTAADSANAQQYTADRARLAGARARQARLTNSADSTMSALNGLRAAPGTGGASGGLGIGAPVPKPAPVAAPDAARAQQEIDGYMAAVTKIKQTVTDSKQQVASLAHAQQIFNARMQLVNTGRDPDAP